MLKDCLETARRNKRVTPSKTCCSLEDIPRVNRDGSDRKVERARDDEHGEGTDEAHLPEHA